MELFRRKEAIYLRVFAVFALMLLAGCVFQEPEPTPIIITEVITFDDGEQVVITRVLPPEVVNSEPTPEPTIPIEEKDVTLDLPVFGRFDAFDPQQFADDTTSDVIENIYVGLTRLDHLENRVVPELARDWRVSLDGRVWTFDLRSDLFWVQGVAQEPNFLADDEAEPEVEVVPIRAVVADDVVFAIQRACDPETGTPDVFVLFIIVGCERVNGLPVASEADLVSIGVRALSETQLEIELREPAAYFEAITTLSAFRPIPRDLVTDEDVDWLDPERFLSSGSYLFSPLSDDFELVDEPVTRFRRNPFWPADLTQTGNSDVINYHHLPNRLTAYTLWDVNLLDIIPLPLSLSDQFLDSPITIPPLVTTQEAFYLGFNYDSPLFGIQEVRQAFSAAIDRERLIEEVYGMQGVPMRHFTPPGVLHAPPVEQVGRGFSPDYARQRLAESGLRSCRLLGEITYLVTASDIALQHAETVIDMWVETLGCADTQFRIEQVQFGTLLANTRPNAGALRPDLFDLGWASFYPDAHNWFDLVLHCQNSDNRPNRPCSEADTLITQAATARSFDERTQLYRRIENIFFGEDGTFPIAPLYVRGNFELTHGWVEEPIIYATFGGEQYDTYRINQEIKELERNP